MAASQPDEWESLVSRHGGESRARAKVCKRVADEITGRGTVDVLRRGVKDSGVSFRVAFFAPAHGLTPGLWQQYRANRLSVVRQLHHSESQPHDSLDVALFVNGIPTASAELKNPLTHQRAANAIDQYRADRNPSDLIFRHRMVVHFAVDPDQVYMTTTLAGQDTVFLAFNQGSGGPGQPGGRGTRSTRRGIARRTCGSGCGTRTRGWTCWGRSCMWRTSTTRRARRRGCGGRCSPGSTSGTR